MVMKQSTNKNRGPFLAFTEEWFEKNQRLLLFLLNNTLTKSWFRWVLRILESDCLKTERIIAIGPNRFLRRGNSDNEVIADFRTHAKFGKRIYFAFRPLWWAIHAWDSVFADRYAPALSYGFDTLTAYPDANPESATVDGFVHRDGVDQTLTNIRAGAGTAGQQDTSAMDLLVYLQATSTTDQYSDNYRAIFLFDTSSIDDAATVTAATLSVKGEAGGSNGLSQSIGVTTSTPASNTALAAADYNQVSYTRQNSSDVSLTGYSTSAYNDLAFNATGLSNVSKTGVSKFAILCSGDIDNSVTWSSSAASYRYCYYADQSGTSSDPKLVVTYNISTAWEKTVTDTTTSTTAIVRATTKVLSQTLTSTTLIARSLTRIISNTTTITTAGTTVVRTAIKTVLDSITTTTPIVRSITKVFLNTTTNTTALSKALTRTISNTVTVTTAIVKGFTKVVLDTISVLSPIGQIILRLNGTVQDLIWFRQTKNTASWTNKTKNTSTWTNQNKS